VLAAVDLCWFLWCPQVPHTVGCPHFEKNFPQVGTVSLGTQVQRSVKVGTGDDSFVFCGDGSFEVMSEELSRLSAFVRCCMEAYPAALPFPFKADEVVFSGASAAVLFIGSGAVMRDTGFADELLPEAGVAAFMGTRFAGKVEGAVDRGVCLDAVSVFVEVLGRDCAG